MTDVEKRAKNIFFLIFAGGAAGFLNGLFGGGGGMVVVPALTALLHFPQKQAHATAILIVLPITALSLLIYAGGSFPPSSLFVPVALGVSVGGITGAKILSRLSSPVIAVFFFFVLLAAGIRLLL